MLRVNGLGTPVGRSHAELGHSMTGGLEKQVTKGLVHYRARQARAWPLSDGQCLLIERLTACTSHRVGSLEAIEDFTEPKANGDGVLVANVF